MKPIALGLTAYLFLNYLALSFSFFLAENVAWKKPRYFARSQGFNSSEKF